MKAITIVKQSKGKYKVNGLIISAMTVQAALQTYINRTMSGSNVIMAGDLLQP